jgi:CheY-like chemotaxis protein
MMTDAQNWNIFVVDDDKEICDQIKQFLESQDGDLKFTVKTSQQFAETLTEIKNRVYDLLILDVLLGPKDGKALEQAGIDALNEIKKNRFIPVIFYTARPTAVADSTPPVWVVQKDKGLEELLNTIKIAINTKLPLINRALLHHVERIQRDYLWGFVTQNWKDLGENDDKITLAYFLARRLSISLSGSGITEMAQELGDDGKGLFTTDPVHPLRYYVIPPVDQFTSSGDIYYKTADKSFWVLLTPVCDLVSHKGKPPKAEKVILSECLRLKSQIEYQEWNGNKDDKGKKANLSKLISNDRVVQPERFFYLPAVLNIPDLVVDFQRLLSIRFDDLKNLDHIASLDSPYAEALLSRFTRYYGRIGTPDLNVDIVMGTFNNP